MKTSYSIGEFSQVTGLSAKTLRFYHEKGILIPTSIDNATGYRFYGADKIEKARIIMQLRAMEFSLASRETQKTTLLKSNSPSSPNCHVTVKCRGGDGYGSTS